MMRFPKSSPYHSIYKAIMVAKMATTRAPQALRPRREGAALPESALVVAAATAWIPKVVPVMT